MPHQQKTCYCVSFLPGWHTTLSCQLTFLFLDTAGFERAVSQTASTSSLPSLWSSPLQPGHLPHPFKGLFSYSPMTYITQNSINTLLSAFNSRFEAALYSHGNLFPFLSLALSLTLCSPSFHTSYPPSLFSFLSWKLCLCLLI